ncbi:MAG: SEC-C domain-containing protein [Myxococcales bacterium]|nr:SEC-C domain-containing protein [Myxococcales bacterium]
MAMMRSMKSELMRTMFEEVKVDDAQLQRLAEERRRAVEARQQLMQGQHPGTVGQGQTAQGDAGTNAGANPGSAADAQAAAQARAQAAQQTRMSQAPVTRKERRAAAARGASLVPGATLPEPVTVKREGPKLGRNDPCHCGSGKKYKSCHYQEDRALEASGG